MSGRPIECALNEGDEEHASMLLLSLVCRVSRASRSWTAEQIESLLVELVLRIIILISMTRTGPTGWLLIY